VQQHRALLTFDVSLPIENMKSYACEVCESVRGFAGENRCFVFGHMADGNLHIVVAGRRRLRPRARGSRSMVYRAARGHRRLGVRRAWHRASRKRAYLPLSAHAG
jgi:hypothetical protein